ncbi:cupredoxin domain-containing protein [Psychromonas hadalis]|uniref:cupredoxin domain-containing protein n=1 Tax=Psychromonas hadalis TaxID=211669 RepID=UPI0003B5149F|nr:cupredoxin family protein [Psychromonas hadalis]
MKKIVAFLLMSLLAGQAFAGAGHGKQESVVGMPGHADEVTRTINVTLNDLMRFTPDNINVKKGETVRLVITNKGQLKHELVIGETQALLKHAKMMRSMPDMQHTSPNTASLEPGKQGAIIWTFDKAGSVDFACLIPGHWEAGMKGAFSVN